MAQKKAMSLPVATRRAWVKPSLDYSVRRQSGLAGVPRSGFYYEAARETGQNRMLMRLIDEQYMKHAEFGYLRMTPPLKNPPVRRVILPAPPARQMDSASGSRPSR
jgi:putative transposase